jgi:hypothetical protein
MRGQSYRPVDRYFVTAHLPVRISSVDADLSFAQPLRKRLDEMNLGEVQRIKARRGDDGEPKTLEIMCALVSENRRTLERVGFELEKLDAPSGSYICAEGSDQAVEFGQAEGLGLYLDKRQDLETDADRLDVLEACTDALEGMGAYHGTCHMADKTALYFYGDSFNKMRNAITFVLTTDPRCKNAIARRVT